MSRRSLAKDSVRNIQHSKGSYYVTIPIALMRRLGWKERQKVVIKKLGKEGVAIRDWKK